MNANQIFNLFMRFFGRKLLNQGISKGVQLAAGKGKPAHQMTPAERKQAQVGREAIKRARQAARVTRRLGR
ncbi:hypothetical protein [Phaeovulum sp. W22_SRMD_FR3]|uniref:hypothetical protein n=1 Tax=Phaeovulum sp. W22_SRMD_FR3 TaxID=3240274 RepID=UPI003F95D8AF